MDHAITSHIVLLKVPYESFMQDRWQTPNTRTKSADEQMTFIIASPDVHFETDFESIVKCHTGLLCSSMLHVIHLYSFLQFFYKHIKKKKIARTVG